MPACGSRGCRQRRWWHYGLPSPGFREFSDQLEAEGYRPRALTAFAGVHAFDNVALPVPVQLQCQSNWCWAAAGVSIDRCYKSTSTLTQCQLANKKFNGLDCCGPDGPGGCNKTAKLEDVLSLVGHRDRFIKTPVDIQTLRQELAQHGRSGSGFSGPAAPRATSWSYLAATVSTASWSWTRTVIRGVVHTKKYDVLRNSYRGSGTWTTTYFTKG